MSVVSITTITRIRGLSPRQFGHYSYSVFPAYRDCEPLSTRRADKVLTSAIEGNPRLRRNDFTENPLGPSVCRMSLISPASPEVPYVEMPAFAGSFTVAPALLVGSTTAPGQKLLRNSQSTHDLSCSADGHSTTGGRVALQRLIVREHALQGRFGPIGRFDGQIAN